MVVRLKNNIKTGVSVGDLMTRNFVFVDPDTSLRECSRKMVKTRVGALIIKDKQKLAGIVTRREILWAIVKKSRDDLKDIKACDVMKRKVVTIKPSADIIDAMEKFKKKKVRRLPVVELGKVIGIITLKDVLKLDPGLFQMIYESIRIREETDKISRREASVCTRDTGVCDECGSESILCEFDGLWLCDGCRPS
jgi:CBS domain-containing protein